MLELLVTREDIFLTEVTRSAPPTGQRQNINNLQLSSRHKFFTVCELSHTRHYIAAP